MKADVWTECGDYSDVWAGLVIKRIIPGYKGSYYEPGEPPELEYDIIGEDGELLPDDAISDTDEQRLVDLAWESIEAWHTDEERGMA